MEFQNFKTFIVSVVQEGNRLQKRNINGETLTSRRFTNMQIVIIVVSAFALLIIPRGFTDNFAGFVISFLGIFIGLFTNIIIWMYDKSRSLFENYITKDEIEKVKVKQIKNYMVQFTGLTSYSILISILIIVLLLVTLATNSISVDINKYSLITDFKKLSFYNIVLFLKMSLILIYRFSIIYFLLLFFIITTFSTTSYFSFLMTEYKKKLDGNN